MRNFLAGLGGTSGAIAAGIACLVLVVAGFWVQSGRGVVDAPDEVIAAPPTAEAVAVVSQPQSEETPAAETAKGEPVESPAAPQEAEPQPEVAETTVPLTQDAPAQTDTGGETETAQPAVVEADPAPAFDEVRREADGVTVIAGRGMPGAEVQVLQNGVMVAKATADSAGKFATIALIPPDGQGHVLSLMQVTEAGETTSEGEIILAPLDPPLVVAAATPETPVSEEPEAETLAPADETVAAEPETLVVAAEPQSAAEPTQAAEAPAAADPSGTAASAPQTAEASETSEPETTQAAPAPTEVVAAAPQETAPTAPTDSQTTTESAPVAVLRSTAAGVELLNTPSPEVMDNVAIDTISYSEIGDVQLSGRAQSEATAVRVYLDNTAVVNLPVDAEGRWRGDLPNVDEGIYTLRIDEVAADGAVTSRVETPFKREAPATLAAAAAERDGPISAITVQRGATLWAIARDRYGDGRLYVRVFEANRQSIRDPDLIYPGQIFDLPD